MKPKFERIKLMYENNYDELNRTRDWPLKIFSIIVALYAGLIALITSHAFSEIFQRSWIRCASVALIITSTVIVINVMVQNHKNYLDYRRIQRRLQKLLELQKWSSSQGKIFPDHYTGQDDATKFLSYGWLSYAAILTIVTIVVILSILQATT